MRVAALLAAVFVLPLIAAGEETVPTDLARLRREVGELETKLKAVQRQQEAKGRERVVLEGELSLALLKVKESEAELRHLEGAEAEAADSAKRSLVEHQVAMERLRLQLGLLTVLGRPGLAPLVVHALGSGGDVPLRVTTALVLVENQEVQRRELAAAAERRNSTLAELSKRREDVQEATRRLSERKAELEATRRRVLTELVTLEDQRREGAEALASARHSAARLERLWGVVGNDSVEGFGDVRLLRGGLPWPVSGATVVTPFGERRDPQYGTVTVSHGIELLAPAGQQVGVVAGGKVLYAQFVKGYGNVVIVDHGQSVYSLYARLSSGLADAGSRVAMGEPVGMVGQAAPSEGNLYLEIRVGDKPQNPVSWLRRAGKRGAS